MSKPIKQIYLNKLYEFRLWANQKVFQLFIFNMIIMLLILLYTAGYFAPFFPLTINFIVFVALLLSIFLLGINSKILFGIAIFFWLFAAFLKGVRVDVWAERTAIYSYQALLIGIILFIIELRVDKSND